jgi:ATP-binding cassette subfamily B protein
MVIPRLVGKAIDLLSDFEASFAAIKPVLLLIVGIALMVAGLRYVWRHLIYGFSRKLERELRNRLQEKFTSLSLSWHQQNYSGDMMALATNDIESVRMAVGFGLVSLMDALALGAAAVGFMLSINPWLSLWAFMPMPLISVLTWRFGMVIYRRVMETQNIFGRLTEVVREQLGGLKVIRAMALEPLSMGEVEKISRLYMNKNIRLSLVMGGFFPLMSLLTNLALALTLFIGGRAAIVSEISAGDFVAFISYLALLSWPMMAMGLTLGLVQEGLASLGRLSKVLTAKEPKVHPEAASFSGPEGPFEIELKSVGFSYPGSRGPVLENLSLVLAPGSVTALTGPTGCGKSTLASLFPALFEPTEGAIVIGGRESREWPLDKLRALFGYVPQDGHTFTGTMRDNLSFGRPGADDADLLKAAAEAALPLEPGVFPQGLDTLIGERGLTLSGGQRQRLALARALLIDPPFLILDDTLSAVDAAVEEEIMERLLKSRKGRGTLVISHRVSSLAKADKVAVLKGGKIAETGPFEILAASGGYLARLAALARLGADGWRPGATRLKS